MDSLGCPACGGAGCEMCNETGEIPLQGCPMDYVTGDIAMVMELADFYEKGLPPVAGGVLDQAANFVMACRYIWQLRAMYKAEKKAKNFGIE